MREHFNIAASERSEDDAGALRQVSVDVPRTAPGVAFFHQEPVQRSLERILYIWGIRWAPPDCAHFAVPLADGGKASPEPRLALLSQSIIYSATIGDEVFRCAG